MIRVLHEFQLYIIRVVGIAKAHAPAYYHCITTVLQHEYHVVIGRIVDDGHRELPQVALGAMSTSLVENVREKEGSLVRLTAQGDRKLVENT